MPKSMPCVSGLSNDTSEIADTAFTHRMVRAAGMRFHVVEGGTGEPLILLAGFPQSWYAWRRVMPLLARNFRVIAVDLPGQGDSDKPTGGYDARSTGIKLRELARTLGCRKYCIGAHDIGSWIAYPYAAAYPEEVRRLILLDANIPGVTLSPMIEVGPAAWKSWHFLFHTVEDLPEALLQGRERLYIEWFFRQKTANYPATFTEADIDEYERVYILPGNLRGALGYYRAAVSEDMQRNKLLEGQKLKVPILALGGDCGMAPGLFEAMQNVCENVEGGVLENCGHYIPEEQPEKLAEKMLSFLGTSTDTENVVTASGGSW